MPFFVAVGYYAHAIYDYARLTVYYTSQLVGVVVLYLACLGLIGWLSGTSPYQLAKGNIVVCESQGGKYYDTYPPICVRSEAVIGIP